VPSIKQVENLLRDPNGIAVRPMGFDYDKIKNFVSAQDDTRGVISLLEDSKIFA
jgi:hypothetical protein